VRKHIRTQIWKLKVRNNVRKHVWNKKLRKKRQTTSLNILSSNKRHKQRLKQQSAKHFQKTRRNDKCEQHLNMCVYMFVVLWYFLYCLYIFVVYVCICGFTMFWQKECFLRIWFSIIALWFTCCMCIHFKHRDFDHVNFPYTNIGILTCATTVFVEYEFDTCSNIASVFNYETF
jgi:hypothetical protein